MQRRTLAGPLSLAVTLTAFGLALPAGCGPDPSEGDPGPIHSALIGRDCNVDQECGDLRCDPVRRQCVCLADEDCINTVDKDSNPTPFCNNFTGLCVATVNGCKTDAECNSSSYCDRHTRSCKVRKAFCEACVDDAECGDTRDNCLLDDGLGQKFCGKSCESDADCPNGAECADKNGAKQCWPKTGKNCDTFVGCVPDSRKPCGNDADCNDIPDQVCDPGSGLCVARIALCSFGQVCDSRSRVCVDACNSDADCISIDPRLRCISRACEPLGECAASADDATGDKSCPANKVCAIAPGQTAGNCVPFCASNNDCPPGNTCQRTADNRSKCLPGCVANADCPLDQRCVKTGSATTGTCQGTAGQTCQADSVCGPCSLCNVTSNTCQSAKSGNYCKPCGSDVDCGQGHCVTLKDGSRCSQPCPAAGCPNGFVCAEICLGTYNGYNCQGTRVAECVPADQSCTNAVGVNKCGF